jgi:hypothetical protein
MFPGIGRNNEESLPEWITKAYNKRNPTYDSITQDLGAKLVTNIETVVVGGFYLAKMPWYLRDYREVISEMIEKAKKDPAIIAKMNENIKNRDEYSREYDDIKKTFDKQYNDCFYEGDVTEYERLQKSLGVRGSIGYKAGDDQNKLYQTHKANMSKCQHFEIQRDAELDKLKETAPRGFTKVEKLYAHLQKLQNIPLLFIKVLDIQDGMIRCHGYDVKTGMIYSTYVYDKYAQGNVLDVFFIDFEVGELYSIDETVIQIETTKAQKRFDTGFVLPLKNAGKLGGKRRSKTNGRFRKYRSRRNVSSRTQRRKKTQRRQRQRR